MKKLILTFGLGVVAGAAITAIFTCKNCKCQKTDDGYEPDEAGTDANEKIETECKMCECKEECKKDSDDIKESSENDTETE